MQNHLLLATITLLLAVGQLLFKHVGLGLRGQSFVEGMLSASRSPTLYAAVALYGLATVLYVWVLSRVPLSQAYPWVAVSIAMVPLLSVPVFGERVSPGYWAGISLVLVGVLLTQYCAQNS